MWLILCVMNMTYCIKMISYWRGSWTRWLIRPLQGYGLSFPIILALFPPAFSWSIVWGVAHEPDHGNSKVAKLQTQTRQYIADMKIQHSSYRDVKLLNIQSIYKAWIWEQTLPIKGKGTIFNQELGTWLEFLDCPMPWRDFPGPAGQHEKCHECTGQKRVHFTLSHECSFLWIWSCARESSMATEMVAGIFLFVPFCFKLLQQNEQEMK